MTEGNNHPTFKSPWTTTESSTQIAPTQPLTKDDFAPIQKQNPLPQSPIGSAIWIISIFLLIAVITIFSVYAIKKILTMNKK